MLNIQYSLVNRRSSGPPEVGGLRFGRRSEIWPEVGGLRFLRRSEVSDFSGGRRSNKVPIYGGV